MADVSSSCGSPISVNIGVMGHVDAGKTSLLRVLAHQTGGIVSTAGLDKHPQSQERGITIDLGFISTELELLDGSVARICFVDCPGHASLIRAVMGAAKIVDRLILVIDATKGIQAQTAECLIIAEILCPYLIVVLNKIDLIPATERAKKIDFLTKRFRSAVFSKTSFGLDVPIIPMAVPPDQRTAVIGVPELLTGLRNSILFDLPQRNSSGPLCFLFDHAFTKKGHGTIVTGTVVSGSIHIGQDVCLSTIPSERRRVRSIQSFKQTRDTLFQGDRGGVCLTGVDSTNLERGMICDPAFPLPTMNSFIVAARRIPQFKATGPISCSTSQIPSRSKFHITVAHSTVIATSHFFTSPSNTTSQVADGETTALSHSRLSWPKSFDPSVRYQDLLELSSLERSECHLFYAIVHTDCRQRVTCPIGSSFIASRLEFDPRQGACRLAFHGRLLAAFLRPGDSDIPGAIRQENLFIGKKKRKEGEVDRSTDSRSVIGKGMFVSSAHVEKFMGLRVLVEGLRETGVIERPFGKGGKFTVTFKEDIPIDKGEIEGRKLTLVYDVNTMDLSRRKWNTEIVES